jgi:hypothetical protein
MLSAACLLLIACSSQGDVEGTWKNDKGTILIVEKNNVAYFAQEGQKEKDKGTYRMSKDSLIVKQNIPNMPNAFVEYTFAHEKEQLKLVQILQSASGDQRVMKGDALAQQMRVPPATLIFKRIKK